MFSRVRLLGLQHKEENSDSKSTSIQVPDYGRGWKSDH